jgi:hypothetical protein
MAHYYRDCYYLIKSKRPKNWQPDKSIQEQIDRKLQNDKKFYDRIEYIKSREAGKKTSNSKESNKDSPSKELSSDSKSTSMPTNFMADITKEPKSTSVPTDSMAEGTPNTRVFTTSIDITTYELANSFILDSGSTSHICNDWTRFRNFRRTSNEKVIAGNSTAPIIGYGNVDITLDCLSQPSGKRVITLENTAYIPSFKTSIASLYKFISKGVYWNTRALRLEFNSQVVGLTPMYSNQWVLEYNPILPETAFIAQKSKQPKPALKGTANEWHARMGHLYAKALSHLPKET